MRFFPGIVLAQILAALLTWLHRGDLATPQAWLPIIIPSLVIALVISFWLGAIAKNANAAALNKLTERHRREREKLRVKTEQDKTRIQSKAQQSLIRESRKVNSRASLKVGAALTGAVAFGVLMLFTQLASIGLILLTGAGGALAGYMARFLTPRSAKRTQSRDDSLIIEHDRDANDDMFLEPPRKSPRKRLPIPRLGRSKR